MKSTYSLLTLILLFFASCTKEVIVNPLMPNVMNGKNSLMTKGLQKEQDQVDYRVSREMVEALIQSTYKQERGSFSVQPCPSEDNPSLYVVSFEEGWKIIPGDSRFGLVLAESATGQMNPFVKSDNPGFSLWIENYLNQIQSAKGKDLDGKNAKESVRNWEMFRVPMAIDSLSIGENQRGGELMWAKINYQTNTVIDTIGYKAPLLQTKWGQGYPWNVSMPIMSGNRCLTGCAAVAVSQILYYFHNQQNMPTGLYDSVSLSGTTILYDGQQDKFYYTISVNRSNFTYNSSLWNSMPLDSVSINPTGYKIVSDFMLDVGARLGLKYSLDNTSVSIDTYGYYDTTPCKVSGTWAPYSYAVLTYVESSLDSNKPVIIGAKIPCEDDGHTWVIDGYFIAEATTTNTYEWWPVNMIPPGTPVFEYKSTTELLQEHNNMIYQGMLEITETTSYYRQLHMNWGWNGREDGYFTVGAPHYNEIGYTDNTVVQINLVPSEFTVN